MGKVLGYNGNAWVGYLWRGVNAENFVVSVNNTNNYQVMPETGYITSVSIYAAGNGSQFDAEIFVSDVNTNTYIVDLYCRMASGGAYAGGQSWNTVYPSNNPIAYSGHAMNIGFYRPESEEAAWSYANNNGWQFDYGNVSTPPSQGGTLGGHQINGNTSMGAYLVYTPAAPIINSISPSSGGPNSSFTISGAAFQAASAVYINGTGCPFTHNGDGQLIVTVPFGATAGQVEVVNPYGTTFGPTFTVQGAPTVSSMSPTSGTINSTFTISGNYFSNVTSVTINGTGAHYSIGSDTSMTVTVPSGATQGAVNLTNAYGTTNAGTFTPLAAPDCVGMSPLSGTFGSTFLVTGHYFLGTTQITLNNQSCSFSNLSDTGVDVTVPTNSTYGGVYLSNSYGTGFAGMFTPLSTPSTTGMSPTTGGSGSTVTITGQYFTGTTSVTVNGTSASFTVVSDTSVTFVVPASATTGSVVITNPRGSATAGTFTVNNSPAITSFSPTVGLTNTVISLSGVHFTGVTSATINGLSATFSVTSDSAMTVTIPFTATTGPLIVTNASGSTTVGTIRITEPLLWNNTTEVSGETWVWNGTAWVQPQSITEWNNTAWTN